jgi:transposase InsO family protein
LIVLTILLRVIDRIGLGRHLHDAAGEQLFIALDLVIRRIGNESIDLTDLRQQQIEAANGSCYIVNETLTFSQKLGLKPVTTPVRSPQSNGMAESFVKTMKRQTTFRGCPSRT